ncbi:MAG: hypothetical protein IPM97_09765 [Bdellovibrionaceae bacterium]|nr:hypothetical protein [Pseudobdellovibrionaceae bacterium]
MTMNPLPPQAYTKDTLTKAYMWLLHQNASIKELATTPDILVSLFLKAKRNGNESLDTPSIQNFKNELKSLAGMMGELDNKTSPVTNEAMPTIAPSPMTSMPQQQITPSATPLDPKSQEMVTEVRTQLNLGSDTEVIRLLISLGYHRAKGLYTQ